MMLTTADDSKIIEIYAKSSNVLETYIDTICNRKELIHLTRKEQTRDYLDIENIVYGGDKANRIDVVFMGDGYKADERDQFFDDIRRLTDDMFTQNTFKSYLPLFNIWAVYVESVESGIGYYGPIDTAFGLYRSNGQLRGVFTGNPQLAREVSVSAHCTGKQKSNFFSCRFVSKWDLAVAIIHLLLQTMITMEGLKANS